MASNSWVAGLVLFSALVTACGGGGGGGKKKSSGGSGTSLTAPVAAADSYSLSEDGTLNVPAGSGVLQNDTDPQADTLTASLVSGPASGTLDLNADGSFDYTPVADFAGAVSFTYLASDAAEDSGTATVTITVNAVNDSPTLSNVANQSVNEDQAISSLAYTLDEGGGSDEDSQGITVTATSSDQTLIPDANITVNYSADGAGDASGGTLDITPAAHLSGTARITLTATDDGTGNLTAQDTFTVTLSSVNDAPLISNIGNQVTSEDTALNGVAFTADEGGAADEDAQGLTVTATSDNQTLLPDANITVNYAADGAADATGGTIDLVPASAEVGTATVTVTVTDDGTGNLTAQDTFTLTVGGDNDAPTISNIANQSTSEDTAINGIAFTVDEGGAADEDAQNLSVTATSDNQALVPDGNISVSYTADNAADATDRKSVV